MRGSSPSTTPLSANLTTIDSVEYILFSHSRRILFVDVLLYHGLIITARQLVALVTGIGITPRQPGL